MRSLFLLALAAISVKALAFEPHDADRDLIVLEIETDRLYLDDSLFRTVAVANYEQLDHSHRAMFVELEDEHTHDADAALCSCPEPHVEAVWEPPTA